MVNCCFVIPNMIIVDDPNTHKLFKLFPVSLLNSTKCPQPSCYCALECLKGIFFLCLCPVLLAFKATIPALTLRSTAQHIRPFCLAVLSTFPTPFDFPPVFPSNVSATLFRSMCAPFRALSFAYLRGPPSDLNSPAPFTPGPYLLICEQRSFGNPGKFENSYNFGRI